MHINQTIEIVRLPKNYNSDKDTNKSSLHDKIDENNKKLAILHLPYPGFINGRFINTGKFSEEAPG
jgi:hypothetical protein